VFPTFAATQFTSKDGEVMNGGTRALNRAMADFCADDPRLIGVASIYWGDVDTTVQLMNEAIDAGNGAVMLPSAPPKDMSPTHPDWDPLWRTLEERNVPFLLHIGGDRRLLRQQFHNNGRPVTDLLGGGENIRAKDYMVLHHSPEAFLSALILDGTFEQFPGLRGGVIELGAMWVVPWLKRLDIVQATFGRTEPPLKALPMKASEYVHRNLAITPFPTEPVGWMIEECGDDLFLFSSDYPHPEGGKDPLARFEASMAGTSDAAKERFYSANFADMLGMAPVPA
jgi:predicted TIM-barrel fold metal-dependent hydrolase